ncbi:MAG: LytR C-terminal domain-containing protein [bacterium]
MIINKKLLIISIPLLVIILGPSLFFYSKYRQASSELAKISPAKAEDVKKIVTKIGQLMELPAGEEPAMATVADKDKLQGEKFFELAQNGDKVLIYEKSQKAILYRPTTNKIVDVSRIGANPEVAGAATTNPEAIKADAAQTPATIALYNGTTKVGLTTTFATSIKDQQGVQVTVKDEAVKKDYAASVVVDLTGQNSQAADQLAQKLGVAKTTTMPEGEPKPTTNIAIILGQDFASR